MRQTQTCQLTRCCEPSDIYGRLYIALPNTRRWLLSKYNERSIDVWSYSTRIRRYVEISCTKTLFADTTFTAADKVGRTNTILPFLTLAGILLFIFPLCTSVSHLRCHLPILADPIAASFALLQLGGLIPFAILYGFASGGHVSLQPAVVAQLGPTESVGVRVGNMIAFQALGSVCQPFVGLILGGDPQTGYRWWGACAFSGSMVLAGASCLFVGRRFALGGKWIGKI